MHRAPVCSFYSESLLTEISRTVKYSEPPNHGTTYTDDLIKKRKARKHMFNPKKVNELVQILGEIRLGTHLFLNSRFL